MKKIIFAIFLVVFLSKLYAFFPVRHNFSSDYQYSLFRSWLRKNHIRSAGIASFERNTIKVKYKYRKVVYFLKNRKIFTQAEMIFPVKKMKRSDIFLLSSELLYRINSEDSFYLYDFLDKNKAKFYYKNNSSDKAVYVFTQKYSEKIFIPVSVDILGDKVTLISKEDTLSVRFMQIQKEVTYHLSQKQKEKIKKKVPEKRKVSVTKGEGIFGFIRKNHKKSFPLEILNNKITSPLQFIKNDFKNYEIKKHKNMYKILLPPDKKDFYADIEVISQKKKFSVNFTPSFKWKLKNKRAILDWGEEVDFSVLKNYEINSIANSVIHLLYEHRSLGKKLFNFLLINDAVPTTLVLKNNGKKELYEFQSYSSLLKLLNKYLQNSDVYFSIKKVKRVNGYIELFGYLITKKNNEQILAEVRFQLDKKYQMKYIMMFLTENKSG